ncbi:hypothetical protein AK812_SmicGene18167 [Symbiodinium microadriaticum]|uniref:SMB domain-containing protein n=1 Tax=Symbiodinium microadriaticum TaxID=2951 RepID=A0A1Q9DVW6_SYMMI|nr:hypothetical protein AK812_SmicGene18167 [Symbiodinium microadriaticum]
MASASPEDQPLHSEKRVQKERSGGFINFQMSGHKALLWARRLYGAHDQDMPSNCSEMGCNMRGMGGRCSCNAECTAHHDCCPDYSRVCPS